MVHFHAEGHNFRHLRAFSEVHGLLRSPLNCKTVSVRSGIDTGWGCVCVCVCVTDICICVKMSGAIFSWSTSRYSVKPSAHPQWHMLEMNRSCGFNFILSHVCGHPHMWNIIKQMLQEMYLFHRFAFILIFFQICGHLLALCSWLLTYLFKQVGVYELTQLSLDIITSLYRRISILTFAWIVVNGGSW